MKRKVEYEARFATKDQKIILRDMLKKQQYHGVTEKKKRYLKVKRECGERIIL